LKQRLKGQPKEIERQRQKRDNETLERNPQPLLLFPLIFFRRKATWQKSKHHPLGEHLRLCHATEAKSFF